MELRDRLLELFNYDPETGQFTNWCSRGRAKEGARAGSPTRHGYRRIIVDYEKHYEHRLAWLYVYGYLPNELDHIDGDRSNNAITNLRECSRTENNFNREPYAGRSGLTGAYLDKRNLQWYSKIQVRGQIIWLGNFSSAEEAHEAYTSAVLKYAEEFAFVNRDSQPSDMEAT